MSNKFERLVQIGTGAIFAAGSLSFLFTGTAEAKGAEVTFGACASQLEGADHATQAPGQTNNGPLTIVQTANGTKILYPGDGGVGCSR